MDYDCERITSASGRGIASPEYLVDLADYAQRLRLKAAHREVPTALASQDVLAQDWLRPEEDEVWKDL